MEEIPQLIVDLALLLSAAGLATIICKKLKQPLVLGYVVAGILVGPATGWLPNIGDTESIQTWADIGVIFLMFGLGLEFSIVKLASVGKPAIITALTEMVLMIAAGIACGFLLGWSFYTCLFLGGMLAISSTTIIVKAFEELGLKGKKFTTLIFGSLIIEDIVGIFLMVLLSTIAVSNAVDGGATALHLGMMALYLVMWFVLSIAVIPSVLKKIKAVLTDEILLIVSIALCLCMVLLAHAIGFSTALGAFIAGSILAGTVQAKRIDGLFKPVKDLFGAVFFVSVGMLVSPVMIVENIGAIIVITLVTIIGKPIFSTIGALLAGQTLKDAIRCGMSLSQIGEFSFIIAGLGVSLGVTADFLYPVIISVSVITTLTTPFFIKHADRVSSFVAKVLPDSVLAALEKRSSHVSVSQKESRFQLSDVIKKQALKTVLVVLAALISVEIVSPLIGSLLNQIIPVQITTMVVTFISLLLTGLFISNVFNGDERKAISGAWFKDSSNHLPMMATFLVSFAISLGSVFYLLYRLEGLQSFWLMIPAFALTLVLSHSKWLRMTFLRLETTFMGNLSEGILAERQRNRSEEDRLDDIKEQYAVTRVRIPQTIEYGEADRQLNVLAIAQASHLDVIEVMREGAPASTIEQALQQGYPRARKSDGFIHDPIIAGDEITYLGTPSAIEAFYENVSTFEVEVDSLGTIPLDDYLADSDRNFSGFAIHRVELDRSSDLRGKTVSDANTDKNHRSRILAIERNLLPLIDPDSTLQLQAGDSVWLLTDDNSSQQQIDDRTHESIGGKPLLVYNEAS